MIINEWNRPFERYSPDRDLNDPIIVMFIIAGESDNVKNKILTLHYYGRI